MKAPTTLVKKQEGAGKTQRKGASAMPMRTRAHKLETESFTEVQRAMPKHWLLRRKDTPDYGIDAEIEIFDKNGSATGVIFDSQLKATDRTELGKLRRIRLRRETCNYYWRLSRPVLIVRYASTSRTVFAKWFHTFDPTGTKPNAASYTFAFDAEDKLTKHCAALLEAEAMAIQNLHKRKVQPPIKFKLILADKLGGMGAGEVKHVLNSVLGRKPQVEISLTGDSSGSYIRIEKNIARISVFSLPGYVVHLKNVYDTTTIKTVFPYDILLSIGLLLKNLDRLDLAAPLIMSFAQGSRLALQSHGASAVVAAFLALSRVDLAAKFVKHVLKQTRNPALVLVLVIIIREHLEKNDLEASINVLHNLMEELINLTHELKEPGLIASMEYNYGNYLRARHKLRPALSHYNLARRADPNYLKRAYFCAELAGVCFLAGRYTMAEKLYERSMELEESPDVRTLLADVQMFCGKYEVALENLHICMNGSVKNGDVLAECYIKAKALHYLIEHFGITDQKRDVKLGETLGQQFASEGAAAHPEDLEFLEDAIRADALTQFAWFNFAITQIKAGNRNDARMAFLMAAVAARHDVEAWANAFMLAMDRDTDKSLAPFLFNAGVSANGAQFIGAIIVVAKRQPEGFDSGSFITMIQELAENLPKENRGLLLRLIRDGQIVHSLRHVSTI